MKYLAFFLLCAVASSRADDQYPAARFTDPERVMKLERAFPEIDGIYASYVTRRHVPGMVWGIVIDGRLAHVGSAGVQDIASSSALSAQTTFRIASMTKSFTALAIMKLRDEGKLSLEDPVSRWIPQFAHMPLPTRDSAPLRVRHLLSHSSGLPEDNPWGDQQLAATDADLTRWLERGLPFSTPPGTRYEYSNYAFALLGRIVTRASGMPYEDYVRTRILAPLHMTATTFRYAEVPSSELAVGYRLLPDGRYEVEPPLAQGAFGAAGGLLTTADDLARYVAFHLSAWPARDDADDGPVRRSSVREMSRLWTPANLTVRHDDGVTNAVQTGYGLGLRVTSDCRFEHMVSHGGGLPGFGSYMAWLPEYGVGIFAMATLTYSGPVEPTVKAWDALRHTGGLQRRELPPSPPLESARTELIDLWNHWDAEKLRSIAAMNLLIDTPAAERRDDIARLQREVGTCRDAGPVMAENWLRGQFNLQCENGTVGVFYTLSPTRPAAIQHLAFHRLETATTRLVAPTGAPAGVNCPD